MFGCSGAVKVCKFWGLEFRVLVSGSEVQMIVSYRVVNFVHDYEEDGQQVIIFPHLCKKLYRNAICNYSPPVTYP